MSRGQKKRIAIAYPYNWENIEAIPAMSNMIDLLVARGYKVDLFAKTKRGFITPTFPDGVTVFSLEPQLLRRLLPTRLKQARDTASFEEELHIGETEDEQLAPHGPRQRVFNQGKRFFRGIEQIMTRLLVRLLPFLVASRNRIGRYVFILAVDPEGLVLANQLHRYLKSPRIYMSFELLLSKELRTEEQRTLKHRERVLARECALVIAQDRERAELLIQDNDLDASKVFLLPNSPVGPARRAPNDFWHQMFNLDASTKVVLYAGSLGDVFGIDVIVESTRSWPEGWVLVVHSWQFNESPHVLKVLQEKVGKSPVHFSRSSVSREELTKLIDSADIGIAFYVPVEGSPFTENNLRSVGLSSGKLSYYLKAGLPVIVNSTTSLAVFVKREECGVAVEDANELPEAILRVSESYDLLSKRAVRTFDEHIDFRPRFDELMAQIEMTGARL
jgi:glycosyltransferase involved in cell wall biosynthesis